ncbi:NAD(P)/FAD-dependent oxidoreductase [Roseofilum reptotaenium CS-1145]|nr:NAD(P)/FAD-dependent oxidoreductase [Roseofilum reptotaenium]MDB9519591.1 NAD(P)/FAD-dependent oxidoreductase [Roseofilum reptotaenium CS-1145]
MEKIIIIGAGPAGLLMAHSLLLRGKYKVELYERRSDPRLIEPSNQRTFPLTLQLRGLQALESIEGLKDAISSHAILSQGTLLHRSKGKPRQIDRKTPIWMTDRNQLTVVLLEHLLNRYGNDHLTVKFDCTCIDLDRQQNTITLQPRDGKPFSVGFDRLVGADGVRSRVREVLVKTTDFQCEQEYVPDAYISAFSPRINQDKNIELAGDRIHSWNLGEGMRLLMVPQAEDWLHGTLVFPPDCNPLEGLQTGEQVLQFLQEHCHPLGELMPLEEANALKQRQPSRILTVKCDRLHDQDRILLIGDAVHAVSASIGQGCNCALQDVLFCTGLLDQYQDDWAKALPEFSCQRLPEVHALRELADYTFPRSKPMFLEFLFHVMLGKKLTQWFPQIFQPFILTEIFETDLPYSQILNRHKNWINRVKLSMGKA